MQSSGYSAHARRAAAEGAGGAEAHDDDSGEEDAPGGPKRGDGEAPRKATVVVVDHEITPSQSRNLERATGAEVLDRTGVIVEIFHRHAKSREAKLEVEIARLKYVAPRMRETGGGADRQRGGIGGKGAGESALELDKRKIRDRIAELREELTLIQTEQGVRREHRREAQRVALVGYTNAGKSTLLNALTESDVLAEDKLFATLDTRSRRIRFPEEREVIITDTVGFIRDLPKDLFAAFRATFEEAQDADLLIHVVDVADEQRDEHIATTDRLLKELDLDHVPRLLVFNKLDAFDEMLGKAFAHARGGIAVTALDRATLRPLLRRMGEMLFVDHGEDVVPQLSAPPPTE